MDDYLIEVRIKRVGDAHALAGATFPLMLATQETARDVYNRLVEIIVDLQEQHTPTL